MFFLSMFDLDKRFRLLRVERDRLSVSEELRGWNWSSPPVEPPSRSALFGVSELAARYCPTLRDIYLRRVEGIKAPPNLKMFRGIALHRVASDAVTLVKRFLFERGLTGGADLVGEMLPLSKEVCGKAIQAASSALGAPGNREAREVSSSCEKLYRFLIVQAAARVDGVMAKFPRAELDSVVNQAIPPVVERKVDGSLIGLAKELSMDVYAPALAIADLKTGEFRSFHKYAPTGYALALESDEETAVDFGFTVYLRLDPGRPVPTFRLKCYVIDSALRREFLEVRDEALEIVENARDPGKPSSCPPFCPYLEVCGPGGEEA